MPDGIEDLPREATDLVPLADAHPHVFPIQVAAGRAALAAGDLATASRTLDRALALVPFASGEGAPRELLAQVAEKQGDRARAIALLSEALEHDTAGLETARRLAALAREASDRVNLEKGLRRSVEVQPFDATEHSALARLFLETENAAGAVVHFTLAMAAGATDEAGARTDLAEALLASGDRATAKREVLTALEAAPRYERAHDLLLSIVDGPRRGGRHD
jgi:tetratricopeptide (TPR) repeat protein